MKNNLAENEKAIQILKVKGPQPLTVIAAELGITTEGARFQLLKLTNEGLVEATTVAKGRGRPQQIWSLTQQGHCRFPDMHAEVTVKLIKLMRETLGEAAVQAVITANEKSNTHKYLNELEGLPDIEGRLRKLVEIRNEEGYMAEYTKENGDYLFIENHCPICAAATACQGFCKAELNTFQSILGQDVEVKRIDHILAGARRCAYRVTPAAI